MKFLILVSLFAHLLFNPQLSTCLAQGSLTPGGAPGPTMKTLDQVEPRRDVLKLSGSAQSLYVISEPGSYYLTTNIVGVVNKDGIRIEANNVTLDLNGFALIGSQFSSSGISVPNSQTNVAVMNGTVSGWTNFYGVYCANVRGGYIERVRATHSRYTGIFGGRQSLVKDCVAHSNGEDGIRVGGGSIVVNCLSAGNGVAGIGTGENGSRIENNEVTGNGFGIKSDGDSNLIIKNHAYLNSVFASNYVYTATDLVGPIFGAIPGTITTNSPWVNFSR